MISHDAFMLFSELLRRGGSCSKRSLTRFCEQNELVNFDGLVDQLYKANLIIALYSYIEANYSYLITTNILKTNKALKPALYSSNKTSSELIKANAKMANVNYRAVVEGTSKRPNENQKTANSMSRQDTVNFWLGKMNEDP